MRRGTRPRAWIGAAGLLLLAGLLLWLVPLPGRTWLAITDLATGRSLFAAALPDGAAVQLTWTNSLFGLKVEEGYVVRAGRLIQTAVTFADPTGAAPPVVGPADLDDLYHTGGPFTVRGLERPLAEVIFLVSDRGRPQLSLAGQTFDLKGMVGFGGRVRLRARPAHLADLLLGMAG
ncbi:MAG: hypothetical protein ACP5UQ_08335, partial [Anaerolineae bacterium]